MNVSVDKKRHRSPTPDDQDETDEDEDVEARTKRLRQASPLPSTGSFPSYSSPDQRPSQMTTPPSSVVFDMGGKGLFFGLNVFHQSHILLARCHWKE